MISSRAEELVGCTEQLVNADSIIIIGGGTVGVELAAEIALKVLHPRSPQIGVAVSDLTVSPPPLSLPLVTVRTDTS